MEDKPWAIKYRPKTKDEFCGERQKKIIETRFSSEEKRPSCCLIQGKRGCGKTTLAGIFSKYYQCENPHEDGTPCEECNSCRTINEMLIDAEVGVECPGVTMVDATINRKADEIFQIIEEVKNKPIYSKYNILLIDEAHRLSGTAQDSLLKTIEQSPPWLKTIFMTTNPEKLLDTIKSRCQVKIEVKRQTVSEMAKRLMEISKMEKLKVSKEALELIARIGDRIPRECISILENVAKTCDNVVNLENVRECTSDIDAEYYMKYYRAANDSLESILMFTNALKNEDISIQDFISGLVKFTINSINIKHGINIEDFTPDFIKKVKELFNMYKTSEFDMLLQIVERAFSNVCDDDSRNQLTVINTAILISKVNMLAGGVELEVNNAVNENNKSLNNYADIVHNNIDDKSVKYDNDINEKELDEQFSDIKVVNSNSSNDVINILNNMSCSGSIKPEDTDINSEVENEQVITTDTNDEIKSFFGEG